MTNFLFFGDSITYGEFDGVLGGYVDYLKRYCHSEFYNNKTNEVNCFNLGIGGETTFGLLKRFQIEAQARLSLEENVIFFFYGANDLAIRNDKEVVSLQDFEKNIQVALQQAKKYSENIFILSILPISKRVDGIVSTSTSNKLRTTERIIQFNRSLKKITAENEVPFIDLYSDFEKDKEKMISKDGVHPNEIGYQFIGEIIKPIVKKYLK